MQTDARLIENVQHADQTGTDLRRQSDALGLAAGERACRTGKRQIAQTRRRSAQTRHEFFEDRRGNHAILFDRRREREKNACASVTDRSEASAMDFPPTVTARISGRRRLPRKIRAGRLAHQPVVIRLGGIALRFRGASFGCRDDTLKRRGEGMRIAVGTGIVNLQRLAPCCRRGCISSTSLGSLFSGAHPSRSRISDSAPQRTCPPACRARRLLRPITLNGFSASDLSQSGTMRSGSIFCSTPKPARRACAERRLLKEEERGASSSIEMPHSGQARF